MENYIMGNFRQTIFKSDKGYIIGLVKVKNTDIESMKEHVNKLITITGYFHDQYGSLCERKEHSFRKFKSIEEFDPVDFLEELNEG